MKALPLTTRALSLSALSAIGLLFFGSCAGPPPITPTPEAPYSIQISFVRPDEPSAKEKEFLEAALGKYAAVGKVRLNGKFFWEKTLEGTVRTAKAMKAGGESMGGGLPTKPQYQGEISFRKAEDLQAFAAELTSAAAANLAGRKR